VDASTTKDLSKDNTESDAETRKETKEMTVIKNTQKSQVKVIKRGRGGKDNQEEAQKEEEAERTIDVPKRKTTRAKSKDMEASDVDPSPSSAAKADSNTSKDDKSEVDKSNETLTLKNRGRKKSTNKEKTNSKKEESAKEGKLDDCQKTGTVLPKARKGGRVKAQEDGVEGKKEEIATFIIKEEEDVDKQSEPPRAKKGKVAKGRKGQEDCSEAKQEAEQIPDTKTVPEETPSSELDSTDGKRKVMKKAKTGKSLSVQRLGTNKIFSARRKRDCRTEPVDPLRKVMKKKVVKPKKENVALHIVSSIKSGKEDAKVVQKAQTPAESSPAQSLEKSTAAISPLHKKKPKAKIVKSSLKKTTTDDDAGNATVKALNLPPPKKAQRTSSIVDGDKDALRKKDKPAQKQTRAASIDAKPSLNNKKNETVSEKSGNQGKAISKDDKEVGKSKGENKVTKKSAEEAITSAGKSASPVKRKNSAQTDSKAVQPKIQKAQTKVEEPIPKAKGGKKTNKTISAGKVEDSEGNEEAKIATKDTKNKQPEKVKVKVSVTLSKDSEPQKEKTNVKKVPEKKIPKKGTPSNTKDDSSPASLPPPGKRKDDTKEKNNKDATPKTVSEQTTASKKVETPTTEAKPKESEAVSKGTKRKLEEVSSNIKESKSDSKKAKPVLSKKRTRANAPSTRSINIKGVVTSNVAKSPAKKKLAPVKAPADEISTTPAPPKEKQAKVSKSDAKKVKVDDEISFKSPTKKNVEKKTVAKKGKTSKVEEVEEVGGSPVMKLLQAAGRKLGILKK